MDLLNKTWEMPFIAILTLELPPAFISQLLIRPCKLTVAFHYCTLVVDYGFNLFTRWLLEGVQLCSESVRLNRNIFVQLGWVEVIEINFSHLSWVIRPDLKAWLWLTTYITAVSYRLLYSDIPMTHSCCKDILYAADFLIWCRGPGRQCCYDERGRLIMGPAAGGHSDFSSPYSRTLPPSFALLRHLQSDITPFLHCCKSNESSCTTFYTFRPSAVGNCQYSSPPPGSLLICGISNCIQCILSTHLRKTIECSWRGVATGCVLDDGTFGFGGIYARVLEMAYSILHKLVSMLEIASSMLMWKGFRKQTLNKT